MNTPHSPKSNLTNKDWYTIACKIRTQNQDLKSKVQELENLIQEQKNQIKVQVIKNQDSQKNSAQYQSKIEQLETKINENEIRIEEKNDQYQKQKSVIENLTKELKKTQQLAASLERDCSLLQDSYNEAQYQLKQKEKENKELYTRLQRQQRYNAQYKTALDQYLTNSSTPPDVNSLRIKSWSENNSISKNDNINSNLENNNSTPENIPLLEKIDMEIAQIDRNLEDNSNNILSESIDEPLKSQNNSNNPILPPLNQGNMSSNQEIKNSQNKQKKSKDKLFLKLPKFGK
ncbi:hypothetical protein [Geminocystis sp. NIES-3709]|uniref:hypothetical protein n=1 Tax=Geminocystis sp. NIES-3709 TaxID=1617448 RepID=UPI0005FCCC6A|nr:hypothetical protein [Geminocystis sp. NIES-3709]BAQ65693.1 hypothetical protein GM3709_2458 [Geminocystis sp. NIES-3709]